MSQYFWPFITPEVSSRSYFEDLDEIDLEQQTEKEYEEEKLWLSPIFRISSTFQQTKSDKTLATKKLCTDLLIIGLPKSGSLFLHAVFPEKVLIGLLLTPDASLSLGNSLGSDMKKPGTAFYQEKHNPNITIALAWNDVPPERSFFWAKCLVENVDAKQVVILDSLSSGVYRPAEYGPDEISPPFLRKLCTTGSKLPDSTKLLESPTLLTGMSAALLTQMEITGHKSTYCYASLLEKSYGKDCVSKECLEAYESILSSFKVKVSTPIKYSDALSLYFSQFKNQYNSIYL